MIALWAVPQLRPQATGTVVVVAAGRTATAVEGTALTLHQRGGGWLDLGAVSGGVPAAPAQEQLAEKAVAEGDYDVVGLGGVTARIDATVSAGRVEPILLGVDAGRLIAGAAYAGNDQVNLGLGELSGRFVALEPFQLVDEAGDPFTPQTIAGRDIVFAAFHTTCHETCPLYTALFLQLARRVPPGVMLVEVTTDPGADTPAVLTDYGHRTGATWTLATGAPDKVESFWKQFGVELSSGDVHTSSLALVDSHGFVRLVYRGVPAVGHDVPPALVTSLNAAGLHELATGGGWGAPDVLQALATIGAPAQPAGKGGGQAPAFTLAATDGSTHTLREYSGRPLVINFWRSDCPPCGAEMPLLRQQVALHGNVRLVLIDYGEGGDAARAFLARLGINEPALLDSNLAAGGAYGVSALPTTFFVRSDGTIDRRQVGQLDPSVLGAELANLATQ